MKIWKTINWVWEKFIIGIFFIFFIIPFLILIVIPITQTIDYLETGIWTPQPALNYVDEFPDSLRDWIVSPESWYGLHNFVIWLLSFHVSIISISLLFLLILVIGMYVTIPVSSFLEDMVRDEEKKNIMGNDE